MSPLSERVRSARRWIWRGWVESPKILPDYFSIDNVLADLIYCDEWHPRKRESVSRLMKQKYFLFILPTPGGKCVINRSVATQRSGITIVITTLVSLSNYKRAYLPDSYSRFNRRARPLWYFSHIIKFHLNCHTWMLLFRGKCDTRACHLKIYEIQEFSPNAYIPHFLSKLVWGSKFICKLLPPFCEMKLDPQICWK